MGSIFFTSSFLDSSFLGISARSKAVVGRNVSVVVGVAMQGLLLVRRNCVIGHACPACPEST